MEVGKYALAEMVILKLKKMKLNSLLTILLISLIACQPKGKNDNPLQILASSQKQWTGVAVSKDNRIFVNYPKWSDQVPVSVAEIVNGKPVAFPNTKWQDRTQKDAFVAVQSVVVDQKDRLWVLDTKNPQFKGVMKNGPVLYQFSLENNKMVKAYNFPKGVFQPNSYFNDVRVDTKNEFAYMTDSGNGAIIVLDLNSGESRRLLDHHSSTESETDHLICDGIKWMNSVHSDGIALSNDLQYLYYIALTGHSLYRIKTSLLRNKKNSSEELEQAIEKVANIPATDGMMFDRKGNLWLGGLEDNSINQFTTNNKLIKVIQNKEIRWADSFAKDQKGNIYFTTSQIHLPEDRRISYDLIKINPEQMSHLKK